MLSRLLALGFGVPLALALLAWWATRPRTAVPATEPDWDAWEDEMTHLARFYP